MSPGRFWRVDSAGRESCDDGRGRYVSAVTETRTFEENDPVKFRGTYPFDGLVIAPAEARLGVDAYYVQAGDGEIRLYLAEALKRR